MPAGEGYRYDFFLSRRGSAAAIAREVADVLIDAGYKVLTQDYDIHIGENFVAAMHKGLKLSRHLIVLLTKDYDTSEHTLSELTNFLAAAKRAEGERRLIVMRVEDCDPEGLLAAVVYVDLVGIEDRPERRRRILWAAEGPSMGHLLVPKLFGDVPPRDLNFTGRDDQLLALRKLLVEANWPAAIPQVAIHGLGGIGKTTLAAEYAHRYAGEYAGVWW